MTLSETDLRRIHLWAREQWPEHIWDEVRVEADVADTYVDSSRCARFGTLSPIPSGNRSRASATPRAPGSGRSTGAIATSSFTSTSASARRKTSTRCSTGSPTEAIQSSGAEVCDRGGVEGFLRSANSPQELQKRQFPAIFRQQVKDDVSAGQRHFSTSFNSAHNRDRLFRFNV